MKKRYLLLIGLVLIIFILLVLGKKSIGTEIIIEAPVSEVWQELTDFGKYPEWNPFIRSLKGEMKTGNKLEVTFQLKDGAPIVFTPLVKAVDKEKKFQWEGRLFVPGIFTGKHTFELIPMGPAKTKIVQREDFYGILVPIFNFESTVVGFTLMNNALKVRLEHKTKWKQ